MNTDPLLVGAMLQPADVAIYTAAMRTATASMGTGTSVLVMTGRQAQAASIHAAALPLSALPGSSLFCGWA